MREFDLVKIGPKFSGDIDLIGDRIVGNAIERIAAGIFVSCFICQRAEIQPANDLTTGRIDLEDIIRLPLIGVNKTVDQLQLVDITYGAVVIRKAQDLYQAEVRGVDIADIAAPVAHDQVSAVCGHSPAFFNRYWELTQL